MAKKDKDLAVITREINYDTPQVVRCEEETEHTNLHKFLMANRIKFQLEKEEQLKTAIRLQNSTEYRKLKYFLDKENAKKLINRLQSM